MELAMLHEISIHSAAFLASKAAGKVPVEIGWSIRPAKIP